MRSVFIMNYAVQPFQTQMKGKWMLRVGPQTDGYKGRMNKQQWIHSYKKPTVIWIYCCTLFWFNTSIKLITSRWQRTSGAVWLQHCLLLWIQNRLTMNKKRITDGLTEARIQPCCRANIYFFQLNIMYFCILLTRVKKTKTNCYIGGKNKGNRKSFLFYVCSMRWKKHILVGNQVESLTDGQAKRQADGYWYSS